MMDFRNGKGGFNSGMEAEKWLPKNVNQLQ